MTKRAAVRHQLLGALGERGERVAGDEQALGEVLFGCVDVAAVEFVLVGEGDGVNEEVEAAPGLGERLEDGVHRRGIGDVAGQHDRGAEFGGQRLDALLQGVALIGERDFGALRGAGLGDAPGDRAIVGDAHDQATLAGHEISRCHACRRLCGRHRLLDPWLSDKCGTEPGAHPTQKEARVQTGERGEAEGAKPAPQLAEFTDEISRRAARRRRPRGRRSSRSSW